MAEAEGWAAQDARISPPFWGGFAPHNLIHGLKPVIPCWAWVSRGRGFEKQGKFT